MTVEEQAFTSNALLFLFYRERLRYNIEQIILGTYLLERLLKG